MEPNLTENNDEALSAPGSGEKAVGTDDRTLIHKYESEFSSLDRRASAVPKLFQEDESVFKSILPSTTHWSVAWSDLMMTMFVLFLSMFIYQAAHKDFLVTDELGILGGKTTEALEAEGGEGPSEPFDTVKQGLPLLTGGNVKGVETIDVEKVDNIFLGQDPVEIRERIEKSVQSEFDQQITEKIKTEVARDDSSKIKPEQPVEYTEPADVRKPGLLSPAAPFKRSGLNTELFAASQETLLKNNLEKFATIKLAPDNTVRIVITSDLLFADGSADLNRSSIPSLIKIASAIQATPYMINVVGHTDNVPMHSNKFATNWELSVNRASAVARFLIEDMRMNPNQFVVSGYSSYRPVVPNTNIKNRAANRRVEIIVSKRLPVSVQAAEEKS